MLLALCGAALVCGCSDAPTRPLDDQGTTPKKDGGSSKTCSGKFKIEDLTGKIVEETNGKSFIFNQKRLHTFKLEIEAKDWTWLKANAIREEYVPAKVVFDGKRYYGAAVRYKGAWSSLNMCFDATGKLICPKLSFKVRFNKYDPCGRFHGMRRIMFNSSRIDLSMMRERVAWNLMKDLGMKASLATHAQLTVNGVSQGLFVMVEQVDKEFLEDNFKDPEGNLYKQAWPKFSTADEYKKGLKTNEDDNPSVARMIQFAAALKKATPATAAKDLAPFIDLKSMAEALAVHLAIGNWDGPFVFRCWTGWCVSNNFYFYDEPTGLISMLPWDLDNIFYITPKNLSPAFWTKKPSSCATIEPCKVYGTTPCPPATPTTDGKVVPVPCEPLLNLPVATNTAAYRAMLGRLPAVLNKAATNVTTWQALVKAAVIADKNGPGLAKFETENKGLKNVLTRRATEITTYLAKK